MSYTEVASQLTPLQVVRLLNELYTQFDLLCDKHEVGYGTCVSTCGLPFVLPLSLPHPCPSQHRMPTPPHTPRHPGMYEL